MGFYLANNGRPWIPRNPGQWLVWDDHKQTVIPTGYPTASGWAVTGYNTGYYDHSVIVRFHVNPVTVAPLVITPFVLTFIERDIRPREPVVL